MANKGSVKRTIKGPNVLSSVIVDTSNAERELSNFITKINKSKKELDIQVGIDALKSAKAIWDDMRSEMSQHGETEIFKGLAETFDAADKAFKNMKATLNGKEIKGFAKIVQSISGADFDNITKLDFGMPSLKNNILEVKKLEEATERAIKSEQKLAKERRKIAADGDADEISKMKQRVAKIKRQVGTVSNANLGFRIDTGDLNSVDAAIDKLTRWADQLGACKKELTELKQSGAKGMEDILKEVDAAIDNSLENINNKIINATELLKTAGAHNPNVSVDIGVNAEKLKKQAAATKKLAEANDKLNESTGKQAAETSKDIANRISKNSSIRSIENLEEAAVDTTKALSDMYKEGICDTEEYITLQYKLSKILDKMAKSYGGVKNSGAKDLVELRSWVIDRIEQVTGTNLFDISGVLENLFGDSDFSLFNKSLSGLGMKHIAELLHIRKYGFGAIEDEQTRETPGVLSQLEDAANDVVNAIKALNDLEQDPWTMKSEKKINEIYQKRLSIIREIGEEKLKAYNKDEYEGIQYINNEYAQRLAAIAQDKDDNIYYKLDDQHYYDGDLMQSSQDLELLLQDRLSLLEKISDKESESYQEQLLQNQAIRDRIALMKELEPLRDSGKISQQDLFDLVGERGTLNERRDILEALQGDISRDHADDSSWDDLLDEAQLYLDTYEKILVTTASGKKLELGPNMSMDDYRAFLRMNTDGAKSIEFIRREVEESNAPIQQATENVKDLKSKTLEALQQIRLLYNELRDSDYSDDSPAQKMNKMREINSAISDIEHKQFPYIAQAFRDESFNPTDASIDWATTDKELQEMAESISVYATKSKEELGELKLIKIDTSSAQSLNGELKDICDNAGNAIDVYRGLANEVQSNSLLTLGHHSGATYFSSEKDVAKGYTRDSDNLYRANLKARRLFDIDANRSEWASITFLGDGIDDVSKKITELYNRKKELKEEATRLAEANQTESQAYKDVSAALRRVNADYKYYSDRLDNPYGTHDTNWYAAYAQANGYDAFRIKNVYDTLQGGGISDVIGVFSDEQITNVERISVAVRELQTEEGQLALFEEAVVETKNKEVEATKHVIDGEKKLQETYETTSEIMKRSAQQHLGKDWTKEIYSAKTSDEAKQVLSEIDERINMLEADAHKAKLEFESLNTAIQSYSGKTLNKKSDFQNAIKDAWRSDEKEMAAKLYEKYQERFPDGKFDPDKVFGSEWTNNFAKRLEAANRSLSIWKAGIKAAAEEYGKFIAYSVLTKEYNPSDGTMGYRHMAESHVEQLLNEEKKAIELKEKQVRLEQQARARFDVTDKALAYKNLCEVVSEYNALLEETNRLIKYRDTFTQPETYEEEVAALKKFEEINANGEYANLASYLMHISRQIAETIDKTEDLKVGLTRALHVYRELGGTEIPNLDAGLLSTIDIPVNQQVGFIQKSELQMYENPNGQFALIEGAEESVRIENILQEEIKETNELLEGQISIEEHLAAAAEAANKMLKEQEDLSKIVSRDIIGKAMNGVDADALLASYGLQGDDLTHASDLFKDFVGATYLGDASPKSRDDIFEELYYFVVANAQQKKPNPKELQAFHVKMKGRQIRIPEEMEETFAEEFKDEWKNIKKLYAIGKEEEGQRKKLITRSRYASTPDSLMQELLDGDDEGRNFRYVFDQKMLNNFNGSTQNSLRLLLDAIQRAKAEYHLPQMQTIVGLSDEEADDFVTRLVQAIGVVEQNVEAMRPAIESAGTSEDKLAESAERAAAATERQVDAAKELSGTTEGAANTEGQQLTLDGTQDTEKKTEKLRIIQKSVDEALQQLQSAKDNSNYMIDLSSVASTEDLSTQIGNLVQNALGADLHVGGVVVAEDIAQIQLYNKELGITTQQVWRLTAATKDSTAARLEFIKADPLRVDFVKAQKYAESQEKSLSDGEKSLLGYQKRLDALTRSYRHGSKTLKGDNNLLLPDATTMQDDVDKTLDSLAEHIEDRISDIRQRLAGGDKMTRDEQNLLIQDLNALENEIKTMQADTYKSGNMSATEVNELRKSLTAMLDTLASKARKSNVFDAISESYNKLHAQLNDPETDGYFSDQNISDAVQQMRTLSKEVTKETTLASEAQKEQQNLQQLLHLQERLYEAKKKHETLKISGDTESSAYLKAERNVNELQAQYDAAQQLFTTEEQINTITQRRLTLEKELNAVIREQQNAKYEQSVKDAEKEQTAPVREQYREILDLVNKINAANERTIKLQTMDGGSGMFSGKIAAEQEKKLESVMKLQEVLDNIETTNILGTDRYNLPDDIQSIGTDYSQISAFINDAGVQASLTTTEIEKLVAALVKAGDIDLSMLDNALNAGNLRERAKKVAYENRYFSDKTRVIPDSHGNTDLQVEDIQKLGAAGNTAKEQLEGLAQAIAQNSDGAVALTKNFTMGADGIAKLDFSILDTNTGSIKDFTMALGTATGQVAVFDTTIDKSQKNMQNARNAMESAKNVIGRLGFGDVQTDDTTAPTQITRILETIKLLSGEMAKTDSADQNIVSQYTKQLNDLVKAAEKADGKVRQMESAISDGIATRVGSIDPNGDIYGQLIGEAQKLADVEGAALGIGKFDAATNTLNYSLTRANGTVENFKMSMYGLSGQCATQQTSVGKLTNSWDLFKSTLGKAAKQLMTAFAGYNVFYKAISEVRKGIGYVKEIDLALTELRKVTDATEESYSKFLDTMASYGHEVSATISELTTSAADWARLNI